MLATNMYVAHCPAAEGHLKDVDIFPEMLFLKISIVVWRSRYIWILMTDYQWIAYVLTKAFSCQFGPSQACTCFVVSLTGKVSSLEVCNYYIYNYRSLPNICLFGDRSW